MPERLIEVDYAFLRRMDEGSLRYRPRKASTLAEIPSAYEAMAQRKELLRVSDVMTQKLAKSLRITGAWRIGDDAAFDTALTRCVVTDFLTASVTAKGVLHCWKEAK